MNLGTVIKTKSKEHWGLEISWWGWSQAHKWRWHGTHIDLGPLSVYNLPRKGLGRIFWRTVSIIIKPLRVWYHHMYVYNVKAQIKNMEWWMNVSHESKL